MESERDLVELAERLGFMTLQCSACHSILDRSCASCEGVGFVWKVAGATLSLTGLVRFVESRGRAELTPRGRPAMPSLGAAELSSRDRRFRARNAPSAS